MKLNNPSLNQSSSFSYSVVCDCFFWHLVRRINRTKTPIAPIIILATIVKIIQSFGEQNPLHGAATSKNCLWEKTTMNWF